MKIGAQVKSWFVNNCNPVEIPLTVDTIPHKAVKLVCNKMQEFIHYFETESDTNCTLK